MLIPLAIAAAFRRIDIAFSIRPRASQFLCGRSAGLVVLSNGDRWHAAFAPHLEVAADEGLEIAIEHTIDIADLDARAKVLRHSVGLQNVAANLRTEVDLELRVLKLPGCRALLFELVLIEPRA